MVGNVTGVSLLETVGVPAPPQAAAGIAPGKNFAAVMQQAGDEAGTSLPGSQENEQGAGSANSASSAQSDVLKTDTPSATGRPGQAARKTGAGQPTNISSPKWSDAAVIQDALGAVSVVPSGKTIGARADGAVALPLVSAKENESASATPDVLVAAVATPVNLADVAQGGSKSAVLSQPVGVPKKSGKETVSLESKPAAKPVEAKGNAQLTALIPQGTTIVPQSDASISSLNATATLVAPVLPAPVEAAPDETKNVGDALATGVSGLPAATGQKMTSQAMRSSQSRGEVNGGVSLPGTSAEAAPSGGTASTPGFETVMAQTIGAPGPVGGRTRVDANATGSMPQGAEAARAGAKHDDLRSVGPANAQATEVVPTPEVQGQSTPKDGPQEAASRSAQPAITAAAFSTGALKQTVSTTTKKVGGSTKIAGEAVAEAVLGGPLQTEAMPSTSKAVPVAKPSAVPAVNDVAGRAPVAKTSDASPISVRNSAPQSKTAAASDGLSATPTVSKETDTPSLGASVQPAVSPADPAGVVAQIVVPVIPANGPPHTQTAPPSGVAGSAVAEGVSAAGQIGTASGAGLPHTTLSATPTSLEVGVSSGTHGWLKIRAELNAAGEVNASLTGTSTAAAEKLRGDLPALNSFLQAEKVPVGVLDVRSAVHTATASFDGGSTFSQSGFSNGGFSQTGQGQPGHGQAGSGQGSANGATVSADAGASGGRAHQQTQQETTVLSGVDGVGVMRDKVLPGRVSDAAAYGIHTELGGSEGSPSLGYGVGGGWLNVRA